MRDYSEEDKIFTSQIKNLRAFLRGKLFLSKCLDIYGEYVDDLINDSFIQFRKTIDKDKLKLNENITKDKLKSYIFSIGYSKLLNLLNKRKPNYFECLPNVDHVSLKNALDTLNYKCELKHELDSQKIIDYMLNSNNIKTRRGTDRLTTLVEHKIIKNMLSGNSQKEIAEINNLVVPAVNQRIAKIRKKVANYLGDELFDILSKNYFIQDKRMNLDYIT